MRVRSYLLLRTLRNHRIALAIGVVLAGAAAVGTLYRISPGLPPTFASRGYHVGFVSQRLLVDTARSQVASDGGGSSGDTTAIALYELVGRANVMGSLLSTSAFQEQIAAGAGLAGRGLIVIPPSGLGPAPGSQAAIDPTSLGPAAIVLNLAVDQSNPLITLSARAPDAATARRLVDAAVRCLRDYVSRLEVSHKVPEAARLTVSPTAAPASATAMIGPRKLHSITVFLAVLMLWSLALVLRHRLTVHRRRSGGGDADADTRDVDRSAGLSAPRRLRLPASSRSRV